MTARRNFKKLVRERMERFGESYTTAARHLAGPVVTTAGQHRESVLVGRLLAAAGQPLSEAMVCGLGGGIGFLYAVFEYDAVPHPLLTIVAQHHPQAWAPAVLDRLGLAHRQTNGTATKAALDRLRTALDTGVPALCLVDRGKLPWQQSPPFSAAEPYTVLVTARDGDVLTVLDPPHDIATMPVPDFGTAWAAHRQGRHALLTVEPAAEAAPGSRGLSGVDLPAAVRDALATTVAHLTGPVLGNSFDVNFGFSGMAKLAAELRDGRTRKGWARRFGDPAGHEHAMRRLAECLEREYTAPGATRPLYADFLDEAATVLAAPALTEAARLFRESGQTWSTLAAHATAAAPDDDLRAWCDHAADLVDTAFTTERAATAHLTPA
ncbi:BtrH N-terminal domain-containing protein [Catellatospora chokoriensis]|uniref:Butirosin biosynthesis protein H-like n=1 Tax=Catellatospora chokoriensis TaxID=310353 RepID=A0A8J3JVS1_9ACTN|nr:BtrH N-terminal domain-containing protein [Catellatospora chokoriensis]GIF89399.1 hypothetical protein Cch02nite_28430 [Catellatospora chokoriensis]